MHLKSLLSVFAISLWLSELVMTSVLAMQHNSDNTSCHQASYGDQILDSGREPSVNDNKRTERLKDARMADEGNSGLQGMIYSVTLSGMPGGRTRSRPISMEFAVAPVTNEQPVYHQAILVKSDVSGHYEVVLPPGTYWIGPKAKALSPASAGTMPNMSFPEKIVQVEAGRFTHLDLSQKGYAP
jgi:hypothetical protein